MSKASFIYKIYNAGPLILLYYLCISEVDTNFERPFLAVQNVRNLKKSLPYKCKVIDETGFKLIFHKKKFVTGKLLKCE